MFDDLRKDSLENLIIDIRGNKGGGHYETNELLKSIYFGDFKDADGYIISKNIIKKKDLLKLSLSGNIEQLPNNRIKIKNTGNDFSKELFFHLILTQQILPQFTNSKIYIL